MKRLACIVLVLLFSLAAVAADYITVTYNVKDSTGEDLAACTGTAQVIVEPGDPAHSRRPQAGTFDATAQTLTWTLPAGTTVRFRVPETLLDETFTLPGTSCTLNSLVPAETDINTPAWLANLWACNQQPECDIVSDYDVDVVDGRFSGTVAAAGTVTGSNLSGSSSGTNTGDQDLSGLLPYTGATGNVDLGTHNLTTTGKGTFGQFKLTGGITGYLLMSGVDGLALWSSPNSHKHSIIQNYIGGGSDVGSVEIMTDGGAYYSIPDGSIYLDGIFPFLSLTTTRGITSGGHAVKFYDGADTHTYYFDLPPFTDPSVVVTFPPVSGSLWASGNDGTGSGLDADTLDGDHGSAFLKAEVDGVIGNEVTDAADTTLTRTGSGTSGDPWKLKLALGNANTWTANQTAPYFVQSLRYSADDPRPTGWPQTASNTNIDNEFNGETLTEWAWYGSTPAYLLSGTPNQTKFGGYIYFSKDSSSNPMSASYYYKTLGTPLPAAASMDTNDSQTIVMKTCMPNFGSYIGFALLDSAGTGFAICLYGNGNVSYTYKGAITTWGAFPSTILSNVENYPYLMIKRRKSGDGHCYISYGVSADGVTWSDVGNEGSDTIDNAVAYIAVTISFNARNMPVPGTAAVDFIRGEVYEAP